MRQRRCDILAYIHTYVHTHIHTSMECRGLDPIKLCMPHSLGHFHTYMAEFSINAYDAYIHAYIHTCIHTITADTDRHHQAASALSFDFRKSSSAVGVA
jgi:hypothetical protein